MQHDTQRTGKTHNDTLFIICRDVEVCKSLDVPLYMPCQCVCEWLQPLQHAEATGFPTNADALVWVCLHIISVNVKYQPKTIQKQHKSSFFRRDLNFYLAARNVVVHLCFRLFSACGSSLLSPGGSVRTCCITRGADVCSCVPLVYFLPQWAQ